VIRNRLVLLAGILCLSLAPALAVAQADHDGPVDDCAVRPPGNGDFGDAPEGPAAAFGGVGPALGAGLWAYPTCIVGGPVGTMGGPAHPCAPLPACGVAGYVLHANPVVSFFLGCYPIGPGSMGLDHEPDGNVSSPPGASVCSPIPLDCVEICWIGAMWGQDEAAGDGADAGLLYCPTFQACTPNNAITGIRIWNCGGPVNVFLNVLVDWSADGDWCDNVPCPTGIAYEWFVVNQVITLAPGCNIVAANPALDGCADAMQDRGFSGPNPLAPNALQTWMRITVSDVPAPPDFNWNGSVSLPGSQFQLGETEDYTVGIIKTGPRVPALGTYGLVLLTLLLAATGIWMLRKREKLA
jgi:hypothetical protein